MSFPFFSALIEFEFLRHAVLEAVLLSWCFAVIGPVLISRRLSLIGDSLSHAMLPGVVVAFALFGAGTLSLIGGGLVAGLVVVALSAFIPSRRRIEGDAALALFAVLAVAVGVLIAAKTRTNSEVLHLLFGHVLAVPLELLLVTAVLTVITLLAFARFHRRLQIALVDPVFFDAIGGLGPVARVAVLLLFILDLTAGFAGLGAMMTVGLLIIPSLMAARSRVGLPGRVWRAGVWGSLFSIVGVFLSFQYDLPSGPAIVAVAGLCWLAGLVRPMRQRKVA